MGAWAVGMQMVGDQPRAELAVYTYWNEAMNALRDLICRTAMQIDEATDQEQLAINGSVSTWVEAEVLPNFWSPVPRTNVAHIVPDDCQDLMVFFLRWDNSAVPMHKPEHLGEDLFTVALAIAAVNDDTTKADACQEIATSIAMSIMSPDVRRTFLSCALRESQIVKVNPTRT